MKWRPLFLVLLFLSLVAPVVGAIPIKIPTMDGGAGGGGYPAINYYASFTFYVKSTTTQNQIGPVSFYGSQLLNNFTYAGQVSPTVSGNNLVLLGNAQYQYGNATLNKLRTPPAQFAYNVTFNITNPVGGAGMIAISQGEYGVDGAYGLTGLSGNGFIVAIFKGSMQYEFIQVYNGTNLLVNISTGLTTLSGLVTLGVAYTTKTINGVVYPALNIYFNGRIVATPILTSAPNINTPITVVMQNNGPGYGYAGKAIYSISYLAQTTVTQTTVTKYTIVDVFQTPAGAVNVAGYNWTYTLTGDYFQFKQISGSASVVSISTATNGISNYSIIARLNLGAPSSVPLISFAGTPSNLSIGITNVIPEAQLNQWGLLIQLNITATYNGVQNWTIVTLPVQFIGWAYGQSIDEKVIIAPSITVTVTNTQSIPTSAPFQQLIFFDATKLGITSASQLLNLDFYVGNSKVYAWIENANNLNNVTVWVRLPNAIPANTAINITIILNSTVQYPWTGIRGSTTYDNGQYVFFFYQTGASTTGWATSGSVGITNSPPSGSPYSNAFYVYSTIGSYMYMLLPTSITSTGSYVIQYYVYSNGLGDLFFFVNANGAGTMNRLDTRGNGYYIGLAKTSSWTSWNAPSTSLTASPNRWYLQSVVIVGGTQVGSFINSANAGINSLGTTVNPVASTYNDLNPSTNTITTETFTEQGNYIGLVGDGLGSNYVTYWTGILIRAYPPNGVMPRETAVYYPQPTQMPSFSVIVGLQSVTFTNTTTQNIISTGYSPMPNPRITVYVYLNGTQLTTTSSSGATVPVTLPFTFVAPNVTAVVHDTFVFKFYEYGSYVGSVTYTLTIYPRSGAPTIRIIAPSQAPYLSNFNVAVSINLIKAISNITMTAGKIYYAQLLAQTAYLQLPVTNKYGAILVQTLGATYKLPFNVTQLNTVNEFTFIQQNGALVIYCNNTGASYAIPSTYVTGIGLYNQTSWVQLIDIGVATGSASISASVLIGATNTTLQFYKAVTIYSNVTYITLPMQYPEGEYVAVAGGGATAVVFVPAFNASGIKPPSINGVKYNTTAPPQLGQSLYSFNTPYAIVIGIIIIGVSVLLLWKFAGVYGALVGLALSSFATGYLGLLPYTVYYVVIFVIALISAKALIQLIGPGSDDDA